MIELEVIEIELDRYGYDKNGSYYGIGQRVFLGIFFETDSREHKTIGIRATNKWQANKIFREKLEYFKALGALRHYV